MLPIPGYGTSKVNAAYAFGGPQLLVETLESATGLRVDHYVEIGFAGFANIVDAVGGVEIEIPKGGMKDTKSGADFEAGKQTLNGEQALAFVRTRYALAGSDLDRTKNQQKFLAALASQTATPSTVLNPFKLYPTMSAGLDTLIVDEDMSLFDLADMFWAMKGVTGGIVAGMLLNRPDDKQQAQPPVTQETTTTPPVPTSESGDAGALPNTDPKFVPVLKRAEYQGKSIELEWSDPSDGRADFVVIDVTGAKPVAVTKVTGGATTYVVEDAGGQRRCFQIAAFGYNGERGSSAKVCANKN